VLVEAVIRGPGMGVHAEHLTALEREHRVAEATGLLVLVRDGLGGEQLTVPSLSMTGLRRCSCCRADRGSTSYLLTAADDSPVHRRPDAHRVGRIPGQLAAVGELQCPARVATDHFDLLAGAHARGGPAR
jgi:hypothetical protein